MNYLACDNLRTLYDKETGVACDALKNALRRCKQREPMMLPSVCEDLFAVGTLDHTSVGLLQIPARGTSCFARRQEDTSPTAECLRRGKTTGTSWAAREKTRASAWLLAY